MADNQDLKEEVIKERILFKDKERKNLLQKILWERGNPPTTKMYKENSIFLYRKKKKIR